MIKSLELKTILSIASIGLFSCLYFYLLDIEGVIFRDQLVARPLVLFFITCFDITATHLLLMDQSREDMFKYGVVDFIFVTVGILFLYQNLHLNLLFLSYYFGCYLIYLTSQNIFSVFIYWIFVFLPLSITLNGKVDLFSVEYQDLFSTLVIILGHLIPLLWSHYGRKENCMEHTELDILNLMLNAGIVVKFVILLLIGFSVYTWGIVLMKYAYHRKVRNGQIRFQAEFTKVKNIFDLPESGITTSNLNNRILLSTINEIKKIEEVNSSRSDNKIGSNQEIAIIERSIENAISECSLHIRKFNATLASISSIAPFVGLFGTVWGIINSFQGLARRFHSSRCSRYCRGASCDCNWFGGNYTCKLVF